MPTFITLIKSQNTPIINSNDILAINLMMNKGVL